MIELINFVFSVPSWT